MRQLAAVAVLHAERDGRAGHGAGRAHRVPHRGRPGHGTRRGRPPAARRAHVGEPRDARRAGALGRAALERHPGGDRRGSRPAAQLERRRGLSAGLGGLRLPGDDRGAALRLGARRRRYRGNRLDPASARWRKGPRPHDGARARRRRRIRSARRRAFARAACSERRDRGCDQAARELSRQSGPAARTGSLRRAPCGYSAARPDRSRSCAAGASPARRWRD